jgi:uncharacterized membrane protein
MACSALASPPFEGAPILPINPFTRFWGDEDGAVAIIVALLLVVLMGFTALGIDVASLYRDRSQLQDIGDLTAVSAMAVPAAPHPRAAYVLSRNGKTESEIKILETGRFLRNPLIPVAERFTALSQGSPGINAVRVVLQDDAHLHFARIFTPETHVTLDRTALATRTGSASFSLGSHILALDSSKLNAALTSRFGASAAIDLSAVQVLAQTSINLGDLLVALDTATGGPRHNPADILNVTTTAATLVTALRAQLPTALGNMFSGLNTASQSASFEIPSLVGGIDTDLGLTASEFLAEIDLSALDMVRALLITQAAGDSLTLTTDVAVAGILSSQTVLTAGEPVAQSGVIALGEEGTQLHRAAARLKTDLAVPPNLITGLSLVSITIDLGLLPSIKLSSLTTQARSKVTVGASLADSVTFTIADVARGDTAKTFGSGALLSSAVSSLLSPANTEFRVKPSQASLVSGLLALWLTT